MLNKNLQIKRHDFPQLKPWYDDIYTLSCIVGLLRQYPSHSLYFGVT